jgi:class 3 adenylate cyclase/tetratricopeptide (TPR) repeat protein
MLACPACGESNPGRARFCLACGQPLDVGPENQDLRRNVSIVFADLVGSTVLGESLDAEALRYVTGRYFETMRAAVESHGGSVEKFIGDAVVALFGIPRVREDDAHRAVRAAVDMRSALSALNGELLADFAVTLQVRIGVNTGAVVVGERRAGGSPATGDAVNVAARLEQSASPGEILIGDDTYRLVRHAVVAESAGPFELKGKSAPVVAWRLLDVAPQVEAVRQLTLSTFVGRDPQLRLLGDAYRRVETDGTCQLVTVLGAAGLGKSRLAEEFVATLPTARVLYGRCLSYGQGATYWPLRAAVLDGVGLSGAEPVDTAASAFRAVLDDTPDSANVIDRLLAVAGYRRGETVPDDVPWAVRTFLEHLSRQRPVVLVIDDLHWAEEGLLDVIEHIADWSRDAPIMLLGLARPEFYESRPTWGGGKLNAMAVSLSKLDDAATASLVEKHDLPPPLLRRIADTAGGNPLFVEQIVATLVDEGYLRMTDGVAVWSGGSPDSVSWNMPPTVSALLSARIDRLPDDERAVLGCAAVTGVVVYVDAIAALISKPAPEVKRLLGLLVRKELLRPTTSDLSGQVAYRFLHVLVHDAAYEGLSKAGRARWHEDFATWLESIPSEAVPDEIVGSHLASAWDCRRQLGPATDRTRALAVRAARKFEAAARRLELSDVVAAASLLQRALDMVEPTDPLRVDCLLLLAATRLQLGEVDASIETLSRIPAIATPRHRLLAEVMLCQSNANAGVMRLAASELVVERARQQFHAWGDDGGLAHTYLVMADLANYRLSYTDAAAAIDLAIKHADVAGDLGCVARARSQLCVLLLFGPTPAEEVIQRLDQLVIDSGSNPRVRAEAEMVTCVMHAMRGRFERARAIGADSRQHLADVGHRLWLANLAQSTARVEELAGDLDAAELEYALSRAALEELGESSYLSTVAGMHARLLARRGKWEAAGEALELARRHGAPDDLMTQSLISETQALRAAAEGHSRTARSELDSAFGLMTGTYAPEDLAEAHVVAADVERALGNAAAERAHLERAVPLFEVRGNIVRGSSISARLEQLEDT